MRRAAVRNLNLKDVSFKKRNVSVEEKGGRKHNYKISREGLAAVRDYIQKERAKKKIFGLLICDMRGYLG
jgi:site-specific recombinase XerD